MKATARRKEFLDILSMANLVIGRGDAIVALNNILLTIEQNRLKSVFTNLEQYLIRSCNALTDGESKILVRPRLLEKFLKSAGAEEVMLVIGDNKLLVQCGNNSLELDVLPPEDFPVIPQTEGKSIKISGISETLRGIVYAMDQYETNPLIHGIYFNPSDNKIELVATDYHRLAIAVIEVDNKLPYQFVLPAEAVQIILKLSLDEVAVKIGDKNSQKPFIVISRDEEIILISRLILEGDPLGKYPNYESLTSPPKEVKKLEVDAELLKRGMAAISSLYTPLTPSLVELRLSPERDLILTSEHYEFGKIEARLEAQGEIEDIMFNRRYFKDIVDRIEGKVTLHTTGVHKPVFVPHQNFTHVLMPIKS